MISLKPQVVRVLEREKLVCDRAITRLRAQAQPFEEQFGWPTELFLEKFNRGEIGDDERFFRWYALAEAAKEWQETRNELEALLTDAEVVSA